MPFSVGQVLGASALNAATLNSTTATTYTPSVTGQGSATFTTLTGWYYTLGTGSGCLVFVSIYFACSGGTGASNVTITTPTNPDRTTRQVLPGVRETAGRSEGVLVAFTGGSGNVWDRMVHGGADITGANLSGSTIHVYTGWYRQA